MDHHLQQWERKSYKFPIFNIIVGRGRLWKMNKKTTQKETLLPLNKMVVAKPSSHFLSALSLFKTKPRPLCSFPFLTCSKPPALLSFLNAKTKSQACPLYFPFFLLLPKCPTPCAFFSWLFKAKRWEPRACLGWSNMGWQHGCMGKSRK